MLRTVPAMWLLALAVPAAAQTSGDRQVVERDRVEVAPAPSVEITAVLVENHLGEVRVEGHDGPGVTIYAVKRAPDEATLDRLKVSLVPDPAGPVRIATSLQAGPEARPVAAGAVSLELLIRVPRKARVNAATWNGAVALSNLDAGAEVMTNEGDITVENVAGGITTHGGESEQRFKQVFGSLDAEGVTGAMAFEIVKGDRLGARLHAGPISASRVHARDVNLRTTRGDISFSGDALAGGRYRIASFHGDVEISFRRGASFRIEAVTRRGTVTAPGIALERTGDRRVGTYGGGRHPAGVEVRSTHGNIRVGLAEER